MLRHSASWFGLALLIVYVGTLGYLISRQSVVADRLEQTLAKGELTVFWEWSGIQPPEVNNPSERGQTDAFSPLKRLWSSPHIPGMSSIVEAPNIAGGKVLADHSSDAHASQTRCVNHPATPAYWSGPEPRGKRVDEVGAGHTQTI